jgi:hypothetical protein
MNNTNNKKEVTCFEGNLCIMLLQLIEIMMPS